MNFRLTANRQRLLSFLQNNQGPFSAAEIHGHLPDMDLVTIYRNLELFTKEQVLKRLHLNTGEACYEYQSEPHHHAVCTECEKVFHFAVSPQAIKDLLPIKDFSIADVEVTVRGTCAHPETKIKK